MNKLAIFVEGQTELLFVEKLINEIAGKNRIHIHEVKVSGGGKSPRKMEVIKATRPPTGAEFYVLIFDCGGDETVVTRVIEEHPNLTNGGYSRIIGLRDVGPKYAYGDITKLEESLQLYIDKQLIPVTFILAIMEIEAWFLAEVTHYQKIDPSITLAAINTKLGFDPENDDMEQRLAPSHDLNECYAIGRRAYGKSRERVAITINALDYAVIYIELRKKINYLGKLISAIDAFLT